MKFLRTILLMSGAMFFLLGCDKDINEGITNTEETLIKLPQGSEELFAFALDAVPGQRDLRVLEIRRDVKSEADLNKTVTVKIAPDPAAIASYNAAHGTNLQLFTNYTLDPSTPFDGQHWTVTFNPGEFVKYIKIKFDPSTLDFSKRHVMAFKVASIEPAGAATLTASSKKAALVEIAVKNKYDGIYTVVSGTVTRYTSPGVPAGDALSGSLAGNPDVALVTVGPNTVEVPPPGPGSIQWAAGNNSYVAGINGLRFTVDPVTNLVTASSVQNATLTNWAGKVNRYDPATKTFYLAFRWNPAGATREYEVVLKYKGPR